MQVHRKKLQEIATKGAKQKKAGFQELFTVND